MEATLILWPVLAQIFLTLFLFLLLGLRKTKAIKTGSVDRQKTALHNHAWPDDVLKVSNNIQNQFQTPVLFYILSLLFLVLDSVSVGVLFFAWTYIITRLIHAYVHVGENYVPVRFKVFIVGSLCLTILSVILVLTLSGVL